MKSFYSSPQSLVPFSRLKFNNSQKYETHFCIQSWPKIEKFKFRLGSVISGLASLKSLTAKIMEDSGILTDQLLGAFGPKLKEIVITGDKLHTISLDALEGMYFKFYNLFRI